VPVTLESSGRNVDSYPVVSRIDLVSGIISPEKPVETAVWAEERSMKRLFV